MKLFWCDCIYAYSYLLILQLQNQHFKFEILSKLGLFLKSEDDFL